MVNKSWFEAEIKEIFERMENRSHVYTVPSEVGEIIVNPGVFSPFYFSDSYWFSEKVAEISKNGKMLDMGTGTGIVAVYAEKAGAQVVATDDNPHAVTNARINALIHGMEFEVNRGYLFQNICDNNFDHIFWNHPWNNSDIELVSDLMSAGFDHNYRALTEYIVKGHWHLKPGGKLLLGTSDHANLDSIEEITDRLDCRMELIDAEDKLLSEFCDMVVNLRIYEIIKEA